MRHIPKDVPWLPSSGVSPCICVIPQCVNNKPAAFLKLTSFTQAPNDDYFSVHIRREGDWTNAVAELCHVDEGEFQETWKMPK